MSKQRKKHCDAVILQKSYAAERKVLSTINWAHMPARWRTKRRINGKRQGSPWMCHVAYGLNYILNVRPKFPGKDYEFLRGRKK
ncbi:hypothetical protein [Limosilactobacillus mucosae]|uniref:hypothetical protein n=1 Tax=Limosilactobacillus mucosae TaxID=97478 RepID=UPI0022E3F855|nr:hypothetical protein [Limosilactobacillus mucosae]